MRLKKLVPLLWLILTVVLAMAGALAIGNSTLRRTASDSIRARAGVLLSHMRDGQRFALSDVYPGKWETAQFAPSCEELSYFDQRQLFAYDADFAKLQKAEPLLLLWHGSEVIAAIILPHDQQGYPRFQGALGMEIFELLRDEANFLCTFIEGDNGRGGYYLCSNEGKQM